MLTFERNIFRQIYEHLIDYLHTFSCGCEQSSCYNLILEVWNCSCRDPRNRSRCKIRCKDNVDLLYILKRYQKMCMNCPANENQDVIPFWIKISIFKSYSNNHLRPSVMFLTLKTLNWPVVSLKGLSIETYMWGCVEFMLLQELKVGDAGDESEALPWTYSVLHISL